MSDFTTDCYAKTTRERVEAIGEQLRTKISSKFTAATFLAGFALTILSGQVFTMWQSSNLPVLFPFSVGGVAAAVVLFVQSLLRLDELTMPKRFWTASETADDTGVNSRHGYLCDQDLWELRKHMIFYWTRLTLFATVLTALAVLAMLVPGTPMPVDHIRLPTFAAALVGPLLAGAYYVIVKAIGKRCGNHENRLKELIRQYD